MLAEAVVEQIRDLLAIGELSQRKIARRLGVSRGSVNAISQDRRPDYSQSARAAGDGFPQPEGVPRRCPGCGGMVQMPCLLCYVRAWGGLTGGGRRDRKMVLLAAARPLGRDLPPSSSGPGHRILSPRTGVRLP